ncbi:MAG: chemotaxis protein CheW [Melioribacteraceae bacterium]|nr:chemotaxis protein CheW [Melioribacteraceae bacterium]
MLENFLVFNLAGYEYATNIVKVPIVLIAKKYLGFTPIDEIDGLKLKFEGAEISIIDLPKQIVNTPNKLTTDSRILVGQMSDKFFGFLVDDVQEILMANLDEINENSNEQLKIYFRSAEL